MVKWSTTLPRVVRDRDGAAIATLDQARSYLLALPARVAERRAWQHAAKLLLEGASAEALTDQIELALLLDANLDVRER